jgi:CheY-like chemotaxis protein
MGRHSHLPSRKFRDEEDASQALRVAQTSCPNMILLDLRMPIMDDYDVIERIRNVEGFRDTPVIALMATTLKPDKNIGVSRGFDGYLQKPVGRMELLRELARFLPHALHPALSKLSNTEEQEEPTNNTAPALLSETIPEDLPELIELLENACFTHWQAARKSGSFEEIETFGMRLQQLGKQYALNRLQELGNTLATQVRNFDVEHMSTTLEVYPAVVENVRKLISLLTVYKASLLR